MCARNPFAIWIARQIYLLNKRFEQHQQIIWQGKGGVQDRTIYEDSIFAKVELCSPLYRHQPSSHLYRHQRQEKNVRKTGTESGGRERKRGIRRKNKERPRLSCDIFYCVQTDKIEEMRKAGQRKDNWVWLWKIISKTFCPFYQFWLPSRWIDALFFGPNG